MQDIRLKIFKYLLQIVGIFFLFSSCDEGVAYQIKGKLDNLEDQTLYAVFENDETKAVDTVTCEKKGEFLIKRKEGEFKEVTIYFANRTRWITAYLEKGKNISINGDALYPALIRVKGGRINDKLTSMRKELTPLLEERTDLRRKLREHRPLRDSVNISIQNVDLASRLANVNHQLEEKVAALVKKYTDLFHAS